MKHKEKGFTIIELLASLAIIAMLVGLLVPTFNMVRNTARQAKQKVQFATIDQALMAFKADHGDYPPSDYDNGYYCGAQKLGEALLGLDMRGFHRDSDWQANGFNLGNTYDFYKLQNYNPATRMGPYLDIATANTFTLDELYPQASNYWELNPDRRVICDSFTTKNIPIGNQTFRAGAPILYYRANTAMNKMETADIDHSIYDIRDNKALCFVQSDWKKTQNPLNQDLFYSLNYKIIDPKATKAINPPGITLEKWPYRADSYILISAGIDGLYGTSDDILNFEN